MVRHHYKLAAFVLVTAMLLIVAVAYGMFRGTFTSTVPVTVTAARAGLVMDPGAKVKMRGVEVGRVSAVDLSGSQAVITLQLQPDLLTLIPANSGVEIESTTVFGAKFVSFIPPEKPSAVPIAQGANVTSQNVTVEFNTVFQNLSTVLQAVQPEKLNATLGAIATALHGRGDQFGQTLAQANDVLTQLNPSVPALQNDLQKAAVVTNTYGDAAPALLRTLSNLTFTSGTIVDQQANLDKLLLDVTGLATTGTDVLGKNQPALATTFSLLRPTSELLYKVLARVQLLLQGSQLRARARRANCRRNPPVDRGRHRIPPRWAHLQIPAKLAGRRRLGRTTLQRAAAAVPGPAARQVPGHQYRGQPVPAGL